MTQQVDKTRKLGLVNERVSLVDEPSVFELGNDGTGSSGGEDLWLVIDVLKACCSKIRIRNRRQTTIFLKQHICKKNPKHRSAFLSTNPRHAAGTYPNLCYS